MSSKLTIRGIRCAGVEVPMRWALGTSVATVRRAPLLLIDLETEEGITGRTYLFCYTKGAVPGLAALLDEMGQVLKGDPVAPVDVAAKLSRRYTLLGVRGMARMALSAVDAICWDALALAAEVPLATLLGGSPKAIPAYNSNGLGLMGPQATADEAVELLEGGFKAMKLRLGYPTLEQDVAVTRAVRQRLPDDIVLMTDFNQALTPFEALRRGRALESEGIYWFEEPIRHDHYEAYATLARELAIPVQLGENFSGPESLATALERRACDYVMPDFARIGGVTGWVHAAGMAAAAGIELSSHLFPEVSAQLLSVSPTCHWLEYVNWADAIVVEPLRLQDGMAITPSTPGSGLVWNPDAVARYRVE